MRQGKELRQEEVYDFSDAPGKDRLGGVGRPRRGRFRRHGAVKLRALVFDAGNTLLRMDYDAIAAALAVLGVRADASEVERAEWRARVRLDDEVFARGTPGASTESQDTGARYLRYVLHELGVVDETTIAALAEWRRGFNPPVGVWGRAHPDAEPALGLARAHGLRTAVLSNSNGSIRRILDGLALTRHLHVVLDSSEEGMEKPDPRFFRRALERLGVEPEEAVYVGDLYSIDVRGARAAGLGAILLDPGACWGARDCSTARTVLEAVRLAIAQAGSVT